MKTITKRKRARDTAFVLWLFPGEKKLLAIFAEQQGVTMSDWIRKVIRDTAITQDVFSPKQAG